MFLFVFYYNLLLSKRENEIEETSQKYKLLKKKYINIKLKGLHKKEKSKKYNQKYDEIEPSIDGLLNNIEQNTVDNNDNDSIFSSYGSKSLMYGQFNMNTAYNDV